MHSSLWPLGKAAQPARILISFLLSKLNPMCICKCRWHLLQFRKDKEKLGLKPPCSALMLRSVAEEEAHVLGAFGGQPRGQCHGLLHLQGKGSPRAPGVGNRPQCTGRKTQTTHCPGEPAIYTFSVSELRKVPHTCCVWVEHFRVCSMLSTAK